VEEDVGLSVGAAWIAGQDRSMWRTLRPSAGQAQQWVSEWVQLDKTVLRERKPPSTLKLQPKVIWDSNLDSQITGWSRCLLDLPKCCGFIIFSASVISPSIVNLPKSPILKWWEKWKSDPETVSGTGAPPKVNQFPIGRPNHNIKFLWKRLITSSVIC